MFLGVHTGIVDGKLRLIIPASFREEAKNAGEGQFFYLTLGFERCLYLFTHSRWSDLIRHFSEGAPLTNTRKRHFEQIFFGNTSQVLVDGRGRIMIPARLAEKGQLTREVAIVGVNTRIEVWDQKRWDDHERSTVTHYDAFAEDLKEIGL